MLKTSLPLKRTQRRASHALLLVSNTYLFSSDYGLDLNLYAVYCLVTSRIKQWYQEAHQKFNISCGMKEVTCSIGFTYMYIIFGPLFSTETSYWYLFECKCDCQTENWLRLCHKFPPIISIKL